VSFTVRAARANDLARVAAAHEAAFPGFFLTLMGRPFLRAYYRMVLEYPKGILLVCEDESGVFGFVAGCLEPEGFYRAMRARRLAFVWPICLGVLAHPTTLPRVLANVRKVRGGGDSPPPRPGAACELTSIGVDPSASSRGAGQALARAFNAAAAAAGAGFVFLTTDAEGNDRVNAFYEKLGFTVDQRIEHAGGRAMNLYGMDLSNHG
jgi:colanic acid biosynthesis glycosyl transferase WcaI